MEEDLCWSIMVITALVPAIATAKEQMTILRRNYEFFIYHSINSSRIVAVAKAPAAPAEMVAAVIC